MERLGASVQELAREAVEDIMGYDPTHGDPALDAILGPPEDQSGHKPPRADIQKMKDVFDHYHRAQYQTDAEGLDISDLDAQKDWKTKYDITNREESYLRAYSVVFKEYGSADHAFKALAAIFDSKWAQEKGEDQHFQDKTDPESSPEAKKAAGALLKKNEEQHLALLYPAIDRGLTRLFRRNPEAYKLYPWFVKQMKAKYTDMLQRQAGDMPPLRSGRALEFEHEADIVGEAGKILSQLRADNQIPQDFDINKLDIHELESWLMEWKRDNREQEAQGKVVYEFHNGWTVQKLESAEALQFEGDEMGHCVGGYSHQVESGRTGIYSLRDDKGMPHVTMEIENANAYKRLSDKSYSEMNPDEFLEMDKESGKILNHRGERAGHEPIPRVENAEEAEHWQKLRYENRDQADKLYPGIPHAPTYVSPEDDQENFYESNGLPWTKEYGVVQVQGKGNKAPKPEYQHMMKEFLDSMRAKGMTFNRSDNWYGNWDEQYGDDSDNDPSTYNELSEWYEAYQSDPKAWKTPKEDAYGLPADRRTISGGYIADVIENTLYGLSNVYDRSKDTIHDWEGAAQMIYHLMNVQYLQEKVSTPERKEAEKKQWLEEIQSAEEKLNEWSFDMHDGNWEYIRERTEEKMQQEAEEKGINLENYEDEFGNVDWDKLQEEHEDEWREVQDSVQEEDENDTYGDCWKFIHYLYSLVYFNGHVGPADMPDPNQTNAGLPSPDALKEGLSMPGTFSKWVQAYDWTPRPGIENEDAFVYDPVGDQLHWGTHHHAIIERLAQDGLDEKQWLDRGMFKGRRRENAIDLFTRNPDIDTNALKTRAEQEYQARQTVGAVKKTSGVYQIHPIDDGEHNHWFDEDGQKHPRYRPQWVKGQNGKMQQTGEMEDTFLDRQGRQGQGVVAYHQGKPVGSMTWVEDPNGWNMLGSVYVHPEHREKGLFNQMVAPLRESGKPIDAYMWNNPWLKNKVRSWQTKTASMPHTTYWEPRLPGEA